MKVERCWRSVVYDVEILELCRAALLLLRPVPRVCGGVSGSGFFLTAMLVLGIKLGLFCLLLSTFTWSHLPILLFFFLRHDFLLAQLLEGAYVGGEGGTGAGLAVLHGLVGDWELAWFDFAAIHAPHAPSHLRQGGQVPLVGLHHSAHGCHLLLAFLRP